MAAAAYHKETTEQDQLALPIKAEQRLDWHM
jgi:hypothetical protein